MLIHTLHTHGNKYTLTSSYKLYLLGQPHKLVATEPYQTIYGNLPKQFRIKGVIAHLAKLITFKGLSGQTDGLSVGCNRTHNTTIQ